VSYINPPALESEGALLSSKAVIFGMPIYCLEEVRSTGPYRHCYEELLLPIHSSELDIMLQHCVVGCAVVGRTDSLKYVLSFAGVRALGQLLLQ